MLKRFIAGVVCPKCAGEDSIRAWRDEAAQIMHRECVDCDHSDEISLVVNQPKELSTRINAEPVAEAVEAQPLRFVDASESK